MMAVSRRCKTRTAVCRWHHRVIALTCLAAILCGRSSVGEDPRPDKAAKSPSDTRLEDAVATVRQTLGLSKGGWELKAFRSKNREYAVVHDIHSFAVNGVCSTWGDNLGLLDANNKLIWAKRIKYHWPIVVSNEGTVALAEWEDRRRKDDVVAIISMGRRFEDGLNLKLYAKTGIELASCPIGRYLDTNTHLQGWVFAEKTLFAGAFGSGDKCFYFATRARPRIDSLRYYPELYGLQRDGELVWRDPLENIMPQAMRVDDNNVTVIGDSENDGQRPYVVFSAKSFQLTKSGKLPAGMSELRPKSMILPPGKTQIVSLSRANQISREESR